jgi:hypothetical protein
MTSPAKRPSPARRPPMSNITRTRMKQAFAISIGALVVSAAIAVSCRRRAASALTVLSARSSALFGLFGDAGAALIARPAQRS